MIKKRKTEMETAAAMEQTEAGRARCRRQNRTLRTHGSSTRIEDESLPAAGPAGTGRTAAAMAPGFRPEEDQEDESPEKH